MAHLHSQALIFSFICYLSMGSFSKEEERGGLEDQSRVHRKGGRGGRGGRGRRRWRSLPDERKVPLQFFQTHHNVSFW